MKKIFLLSFMVLVSGLSLGQNNPAGKTQPYDAKKTSEVLGYNVGKSFVDNGVEINVNVFIDAFKKALAKKPSPYSQAETQQILMALDTRVRGKKEAEMKVQGDKNMKEATAFLQKNKTKAGVKETASGLQYEVLKEGKGAKPKAEDTVKVHYAGTLINGKEFDSSIKRGQPTEFPVNQVIPGWTEALQLMPVGAKYRLYIPPQLAYGNFAPPGSIIEPNSLLIFEVELLGITPAPAKK